MIKWIGQHIWDLISRFRNDVYLEDLSSSSDTRVLVANSTTGKVTYNTGAGGAADQNLFETIAVSGQSNVVADTTTDTLTLVQAGGMTITTNAGTDTVTLSSADTNTQLSTEQVQDIVGGMVTGNTEVGITVAYEDGDGTLDFSVLNSQDESFTFFASSLTQTTGTSTGKVFQSTASAHNQITTLVTLGAVNVQTAIRASIKACPGPRILYDGKLVIHGVADGVTGQLAIYRVDICESESVSEGTVNLAGSGSALMGLFTFELKGANVPVCVDLSLGLLAARTVTDKDIIIPVVYNMSDSEANWTADAVCTLSWKIT